MDSVEVGSLSVTVRVQLRFGPVFKLFSALSTIPKSLEKMFPLQRKLHNHSRRDKCRLLLARSHVVVCMSAKCHHHIKRGEDERENDTGGGRLVFPFIFQNRNFKTKYL